MNDTIEVDEVLARQVAGDVFADIRTVRRALRGERVRGIVGQRIARAIKARQPTHSARVSR